MIRHWKKEKGSHFLKSAFANILGAIHLLRYRSYPTLLQTWRYLAILPNYPGPNLPIFVHPQSLPKSGQTTSTLWRDSKTKLRWQCRPCLSRKCYSSKRRSLLTMLKVLEMKFWPCTFLPRKLRKKTKKSSKNLPTTSQNITLKNINTSYRDIITPTVRYVRKISQEAKKKNYTVTVLVPQFIPNKPWQNILHNQMSLKLKYALRWHEDVVVASYSYHLKE